MGPYIPISRWPGGTGLHVSRTLRPEDLATEHPIQCWCSMVGFYRKSGRKVTGNRLYMEITIRLIVLEMWISRDLPNSQWLWIHEDLTAKNAPLWWKRAPELEMEPPVFLGPTTIHSPRYVSGWHLGWFARFFGISANAVSKFCEPGLELIMGYWNQKNIVDTATLLPFVFLGFHVFPCFWWNFLQIFLQSIRVEHHGYDQFFEEQTHCFSLMCFLHLVYFIT